MSKTNQRSNVSDFDLYQVVTDRIVAELEQGRVPWHRPWNVQAPMNFVSKKAYRGINVLLLGLSNHSSPFWMTFKQAQEKGGSVRKGEKSTMIIYWKQIKVQDKDSGKDKTIPYLRYFKVFNADQIDGIEFPALGEFVPQDDADAILDHFSEDCSILHDSQSAYYSPSLDEIHLPAREAFESTDGYYATAFHEAIHATGHKSRLDREGITGTVKFGSGNYGKEELVAELGSAFVCSELGIERIEPNAAYIRSWLTAIQGDKKLIVGAAGKAAKAADYILGRESA